MMRATVDLWARSMADAMKAFGRAPVALVGLLLAQTMVILAFELHGRIGDPGLQLAAGFGVALLAAGCVGTYLDLVRIALDSSRAVGWAVLRESMGMYLWDVINIMFLFWIGELLIVWVLSGQQWLGLVWMVVFVLFNPTPELICQGHHRSIQLLGEAYQWVLRNGPEWFLPHVALGAGVYALSPSLVIPFLQSFGPRFHFVEAGWAVQLALAGGMNAWALGMGLGAAIVIHVTMLFRGALFRNLGVDSRRSRAWKARLK
ncbi:MAG: hypothetical protein QGG40_09490 [Myxococcota bacterium]|jgi:hypothetical protein|nr:hypothetical protein [Myxococcota bacterium]